MTDWDPDDSVRREMTGFAKRLEERYGRSADPNISLDPEAGRSATAEELPAELFETRADKRLKRLENLTPAEFRYEFKGEVGRGGMGVVYKVRDRDLGRHLAMKVVSEAKGDSTRASSRSKLTRFLEEAQITGQLDHPGIVPVHELGMDTHGRCFFTMRLVKGRDFKEVIEVLHATEPSADSELRGWTRNRALWALHRICETMAFAHSKGVVHRDLKPSNIMVGRFGETYVMDWGLAKIQGRDDERDMRPKTEHASVSIVRTDRVEDHADDPDSPLMTMDGDVIGTPAYMSPEQARGEMEKIGPQSDVYSLGAILYHLLTGRAPYTEPGQRLSPHVVLMKVLAGHPPRIHTIAKDAPAELAAICEKAMAYSRKKRYASMMELAEDLSAFLEGRVVAAHDTGSIAEFRKWVERNKPFAAALAAALVVLITSLTGILYVTKNANADLESKNDELELSRSEAQSNATRALESQRTADEARQEAVRNAQFATRQSYISHVRAANSSVRLDEIPAALEHLAFLGGSYAGWESDYLKLATDTSLARWQVPFEGEQVVELLGGEGAFACLTDEPRHAIELRSLEDGRVLRSFAAHSQPITALAHSEQGRLLASAARDRTVRVWDLAGEGVLELPLIASVESLAFSQRGNQLAVATKGVAPDNGRVLVFDLSGSPFETPPTMPVADFDGGSGVVAAVAFGPRGRRVLAGTADGSVRMYDLTTGTLVLEKVWSESPVRTLAISPSGSTFVAASKDGVLRVASSDTGAIIAQRAIDSAVATDCSFLPGGRVLLACNDGNLRLFDPNDASLVGVHGHVEAVTSLSGQVDQPVVISGSSDGSIRTWSIYALQPITSIVNVEDKLLALAHHPSSSVIATAGNEGDITLRNALSGGVQSVLSGHKEYVPALAFSPSGRWLASGSGDRTVRIWDANRGEVFTILVGHEKWISDLAFAPEGRFLASTSGDQTARVWDIETERSVAVLEGHATWINCLAWDATGTRLFTGDGDGRVNVWDPFRGALITSYAISDRSIQDLEIAPDGKTIFAGSLDGSIHLIDVETGGLRSLDKHRVGITALSLAPDGARLASADSTGAIIIWDTSDWEALMQLPSQTGLADEQARRQIKNLLFSPSGKRLISTADGRAFAHETGAPLERHQAQDKARSVVDIVDTFFGDFGAPSTVLETLRSAPDMEGALRDAAIRAVTIAASDPDSLVEQAWRILMNQDEDLAAYQNAFELARMAADLRPGDIGILSALAAGKYRTGDLEGAAHDFEGLLEELEPSSNRPELAIFAAMTALARGEVELAGEQLQNLAEPMARPAWQTRAGALYREALTILEGLR